MHDSTTSYMIPSFMPVSGNADALCYRSDSNGAADSEGTYLYLATEVYYNSYDTISVGVKYRAKGASAYSSTVLALSNDVYNGVISGITLDTTTAYDVEITATPSRDGTADAGRSAKWKVSIPSGKVFFQAPAGGEHVGILAPALTSGENSVNFGGRLYFNDHAGDYVVRTRTQGYWYVREWASGFKDAFYREENVTYVFNSSTALAAAGLYNGTAKEINLPSGFLTGYKLVSVVPMFDSDGYTVMPYHNGGVGTLNRVSVNLLRVHGLGGASSLSVTGKLFIYIACKPS